MALRHLDLASLSLFRAICAHGSITHGAQAWGIALGAASRRIAELERRAGSTLLMRSKSGVRPTAAGQTLLEHADRLSREADRLDLSLEDYRLGIDTRIRVWANTSAVNGFLPARVASFSRARPRVRLDLHEEFSEAIVRAVSEGQAEVGVFAASAPARSLHTQICDTHRLVVICPRSHPVSRRRRLRLDELLDHDYVALSSGTALQKQVELEAARTNRPLRLRIQARSYDAVCMFVSAGLGLSLVPEQVARLMAPSLGLTVARFDEPWALRHLVAAVRSVDELTDAAREFFTMLTA